MATLKNIFDKCGVALYQNESLDLDHYYQEPYQDEGDEIKAIGKPFETNDSISIIDSYFASEPQTAEALREEIKSELSVKKK